VVTTGAINRAKLQSNHRHHHTNTQFFTGRMPFLSSNEQCQSTEGKSLLLFDYLLLLLLSIFVLQVTSVAKGLPTKNLCELLNQDFYRLDVLPVTQPSVSKSKDFRPKSYSIYIYI